MLEDGLKFAIAGSGKYRGAAGLSLNEVNYHLIQATGATSQKWICD